MATDTALVKEREDADCCRYCGRPTWSMRRCCVRCKRAGRLGPGTFASWHATGARRAPALAAFWLGHVAPLTVLSIAAGIAGTIPPDIVIHGLQLGLFESTLSTVGFGIAIVFAPRPPRAASRSYLLVSVVAGLIAAIVVNVALVLLWFAVDPPFEPAYVVLLVVLISANVGRVVLGVGISGRSPESNNASAECTNCGRSIDSTENQCCTCRGR